MVFFLDTNTCIYALNGRFAGIERRLGELPPSAVRIPSMVKAELLFGARKSRRAKRTSDILDHFLLPFEITPFDDLASATYARIRVDLERRGLPIGGNDLLIAATVLSRGGTLVTHKVREFQRIDALVVEDWTK